MLIYYTTTVAYGGITVEYVAYRHGGYLVNENVEIGYSYIFHR